MESIGDGLRRCTAQNWNHAYSLSPVGAAGLNVNLEACEYIDSGFLTRLACVVDRRASEGVPVTVQFGMGDPARYASRLGLRRLLEEVTETGAEVTHDLPLVNEHPSESRFVELQRFGGPELADDLIDLIDARMSAWGDDSLASVLYNHLYELGLNIEEHAGRPGFVMAQWFPSKERLEIAVVDYGIGIRESLARSGQHAASDAEAIRMASQHGITSKPKDGGNGLRSVRNDAGRYSGVLKITCGDAEVTWQSAEVPTVRTASWDGTAVDFTYTWK